MVKKGQTIGKQASYEKGRAKLSFGFVRKLSQILTFRTKRMFEVLTSLSHSLPLLDIIEKTDTTLVLMAIC